jgi:predicted MPP superfamily phosphohydrolase
LRPLAFIAVYFALFAYPPVRVMDVLFPNWQPGAIALVVLFIGPACGWLAYQRWKNDLTRALMRITYTWMGLGFIALCVLLPWELVTGIPGVDPPIPTLLLAVPLAMLWALGIANAQRLRVKTIVVRSAKVQNPTTLVHLSDVHVGSRTPAFLRRVARRVNTLSPDAVVITGDLVDFAGMDSQMLSGLGELDAPSYFSIGNHERYVDCDAICERVAGHGVHVLRNRAMEGNQLRFVGIDDADDRKQVSKQLTHLPLNSGPFTVLLYHRPDDFEAAAEAGIDLMLCGHTHNGQIAPFNFLVKRIFPRIAGRHEHADGTLYVSPGTGTWGPILRLGSVNEITLIRLEPAAAS